MTPQQVGRYQLKRELDRGGMSTVYLAHDPNVDRDVALKLLPREFLHHESFRKRFNREAKIIASLEHWAIVPIFDFGEDDGLSYFVMRYMPGGSLADRLNNGPLSIDEAAEILKRVGSALDYAHSKGIVHRDMKPGNILFDQFGQAYLGDFGIAHLEQTGATLTGTAYMGTPAYVSPEQVQATGEVDGRADIYALGVILFEVLTGEKPFKAENAAFLALKHLTDPVPSILEAKPDLPPDTDQIITRAMAKNPDERYSTATDMTAAVALLAAGQAVGTIGGAHEIQAAPSSGDIVAGAMTAGTKTAPSATKPVPDLGASPGIDEASSASLQSRFPIWLIVLVAGFMVVCLGVTVISIAVAGGGGLFGIISDPTATATNTPEPTATNTPEPTATEFPTDTPTATATSTPTPTTLPSPTPTVTASPTELIPPTLRPTLTPEPTNTLAPTPLPTNTPVPPTATSAPPPDSGGGSDGGGSDNGGSNGGGSDGGGSGGGDEPPPEPPPEP